MAGFPGVGKNTYPSWRGGEGCCLEWKGRWKNGSFDWEEIVVVLSS